MIYCDQFEATIIRNATDRECFNKTPIDWFVAGVVALGLVFSVTNFTVLSVFPAFLIFVLPYVFVTRKLSPLSTVLLTLFVYFALQVVLLSPGQLLKMDFYRRDGNFFITFAPLLVLSSLSVSFELRKLIKIFVWVGTAATTAALVLWFVSKPYPEFRGLFYSHNGAGGFLGILVLCSLYLVAIKPRMILNWVFLLLNCANLYFTNSRGSILALLLAFPLFYMFLRKKRLFIVLSAAILAGFIVVEIYYSVLMGPSVLYRNEFYVPAELANTFLGRFLSSSGFNRSWTLTNRLFYLWPKAMYLFRQSPLFGIGMSGYNNEPYVLTGIPGVFTLNLSPNIINHDNHAHNTFLHVMAENGLFGLFLLIMLIVQMARSCKSDQPKIGQLLGTMLIYCVLSALTEHRFFTPSQMVPFILLLGANASTRNYGAVYYVTLIEE